MIDKFLKVYSIYLLADLIGKIINHNSYFWFLVVVIFYSIPVILSLYSSLKIIALEYADGVSVEGSYIDLFNKSNVIAVSLFPMLNVMYLFGILFESINLVCMPINILREDDYYCDELLELKKEECK